MSGTEGYRLSRLDAIARLLQWGNSVGGEVEGYRLSRLDAIARLLQWGNSVGGEVGGAYDIKLCREAIARDLRLLGVTDDEMSVAIRREVRADVARRHRLYGKRAEAPVT